MPNEPTDMPLFEEQTEYDYQVFRADRGWGTVEAWGEGRPKHYLSNSEEITENRKAGLHYSYNADLGYSMWSPIDRVPPKSDYVPKKDITQKEIDIAVDSIQQRTNHINDRLNKSITDETFDTDDGISLSSDWINKFLEEAKSWISSPKLADTINNYMTMPVSYTHLTLPTILRV